MPEAIKRIGVQFMKEPEHVKIAAKELTTDLVDQYYIRVKEGEKFDTHDSIDGCRATGACHCLWSD